MLGVDSQESGSRMQLAQGSRSQFRASQPPSADPNHARMLWISRSRRLRMRGAPAFWSLHAADKSPLIGAPSRAQLRTQHRPGPKLVRPNTIDTISTSDLLDLPEGTRLLQSADHIRDTAVAAGGPDMSTTTSRCRILNTSLPLPTERGQRRGLSGISSTGAKEPLRIKDASSCFLTVVRISGPQPALSARLNSESPE
jgi:hypothetical protein